jgi:acyl carrier protein
VAVTRESLVAFLAGAQHLDPAELADDTPLFSSGLVDSFTLVDLLDHLEREGGFRMRHADVTVENLDSVARILHYAEARANGEHPA